MFSLLNCYLVERTYFLWCASRRIFVSNTHKIFELTIKLKIYYYSCWVSSEKHPNHIWIFVGINSNIYRVLLSVKMIDNLISGPALSAILFNALIMFLLFREILGFNQRNERYAKHVSKLKQIFSFTSLTFNLGLTWILFILYIHRFGTFYPYFSYVFIILNGSQVSQYLII